MYLHQKEAIATLCTVAIILALKSSSTILSQVIFNKVKEKAHHSRRKDQDEDYCRQRMSLKLPLSGSVFELEKEARRQKCCLGRF